MTPLQQSAPTQLSPPPSSPRQGLIRLLQHNKDPYAAKSNKEVERSGTFAPRILSKGSSPMSQHASLGGQSSLDGERESPMIRSTIVQDRSTSFTKRDNFNSKPGLDGGLNIIDGSKARLDEARESQPKQNTHQHQHSHLRQINTPGDYAMNRGGSSHHRGYHHDHGQGHGSAGMSRGGWTGSTFKRNASSSADFGSRLDVETARPGQSNQAGKLFDPRKDDPVKFASIKTKYGLFPNNVPIGGFSGSTSSAGTYSISSISDARSIISATSTNASSTGKEKRRRRGPSSRTTNDSNERKKAGGAREIDNNSYVSELKRWYREIALVEQVLQEEHRNASERQRKEQAECSSAAVDNYQNQFRSKKAGFTAKGELDHPYWINLINRHRYLAETHAAFMEAALKPGLPTSLHSLPQNYNIPTRLWHTGFYSLLERLRHLLPTSEEGAKEGLSAKDIETHRQVQREILDLLIEFIYFAYSFYTNLLESETFRSFRNSWIENLGDLARYRMAIAKIMSKNEIGSKNASIKESKSNSDLINSEAKKDFNDSHDGSNVEKSSIGFTALNEWDMEEKEVWRSTAKEWYAKGLAEMPGIGRLHHHLGILSRDDELRSLHHFCKSLTCSHPYPSARESILPLFDRDTQQNRLRSDATLVDLFIYLHGILFTKIQLDDFDEILLRFKVKLCTLLDEDENDDPFPPSIWMMMAAIDIASLSQYSTLPATKLHTIDRIKTKEDEMETNKAEAEVESGEEAELEDDDDDDDIKGEEETKAIGQDTIQIDEVQNAPITTLYAAQFTSVTLEILISRLIQSHQSIPKINPYVIMLLTFISQECKQSSFLQAIEKYLPWQALIKLMSRIPLSIESIDPRKDVAMRIKCDSGPLAEDWALRGMAWVGRKVFERGFWKSKITRGVEDESLLQYESEVDMLNKYSLEQPLWISSHVNAPFGRSGSEEEEEEEEGKLPTVHNAKLRWKRVAYTLTVLIKTIPGLDYQANFENERNAQYLITSPLKEKMYNWEMEEKIKEQEKSIKNLKIDLSKKKTKCHSEKIIIIDSEEEVNNIDALRKEEEEVEQSEEIRQLKARRKVLKEQLLESKDALFRQTTLPANVKRGMIASVRKTQPHILPGYTILVLDTNVMLTPTSILEMLVDSEKWCTIIPLVVVTELDGITKRPGAIGQRAIQSLDYLEKKLKSKSSYVKVQTSRGNYLNDLQFKTEEIQFSVMSKMFAIGDNQGVVGTTNLRGQDQIEDENDQRSARSIDEVILYCLDWQMKHFMDRSAFLCKDKFQLHKIQNQITSETLKSALITLDKNLRLKARYHNLIAVGPDELVNLLEPA